MVNLLDPDAADRIIQLERRLGWPGDSGGKEWEDELRQEIDSLRAAFRDHLELTTLSDDGMIYGQDGWDRYMPRPNGEIVFKIDFCDHMDKATAGQAAQEIGFTVG